MKKRLAIVVVALVVVVAIIIAVCTSCGNEKNTATPDEATSVTETTEESSNIDTALNEDEQAIVNAGLTVDENGDIVNEDGEKVEVNKNGEVEVKTADGKVVKVSEDEVKAVSNSKNTTSEKKDTSKGNSTSKNTESKNTAPTVSNSSKGNSSTSSKPSKGSNSNNSSSTPSKGNSSSNNSNSSTNKGTTSDPHAGKTWHEAEYKTVNHPAETKKVWVVDQEAYTYEEPVYETQWRTICKVCGADITDEGVAEHDDYHWDRGENFCYGNYKKQVQVGTKTVTVPEQGHWETKVIKEAWSEKVLVREAGWY